MLFIVKLNLIVLGVGAILAGLCFYLDRRLLQNYKEYPDETQETAEFVYLSFMKTLTVFYFMDIFLITISLTVIAVLSMPHIFSLPPELSLLILVGEALFVLGGIATLPVALKKRYADTTAYISVSHMTEPILSKLSDELAERFDISSVDDIHITPGAEIEIAEDVNSLDNIFSGGYKRLKIGLSSLQFLTASDLKVLLARQFAYYDGSDESAGIVIKRLNQRFQAIADNIIDYEILLSFNPVAWFAFMGRTVISNITSGYSLVSELKADVAAAEYSGTSRLKNALARYHVESELLKETINTVNSKREYGQDDLGNIYQAMKGARFKTSNEIGEMVKYLFDDYQSDARKGTGHSLKLRLRRLPEKAVPVGRQEASEPDIKYPAYTYLNDWLTTENRMMRIIGSDPNLYVGSE
ncbi:MAG: hypothetical protein J7K40_08150 [candidate division Zixibacteria bacterium]|nr:hypothetical protein [candidate division Zixibacteria bacterium]